MNNTVKVDKGIVRLISELEEKIGNSCYNPNSYDGWREEYGAEFRYPVWYKKSSNAEEEKTNWLIPVNLSPKMISSIYYKFGSNHLLIGSGLVRLLQMIETRYGISINELEKRYQEQCRRIAAENKAEEKFQLKIIAVLRKKGYECESYTHPYGLYAIKKDTVAVIMTINKERLIDIDDVNELLYHVETPNNLVKIPAQHGWIITNGSFSDQAKLNAEEKGLLLFTYDDWMEYINSDSN